MYGGLGPGDAATATTLPTLGPYTPSQPNATTCMANTLHVAAAQSPSVVVVPVNNTLTHMYGAEEQSI